MPARVFILLVSFALALALACGDRHANNNATSPPPAPHDGEKKSRAIAEAPNETFTPPAADGFGRAGALRYLERRLGGADEATPLPMVIMIHGLGDKPRHDWFGGASAVTTPMRLIMPEAQAPHHGGFAWFPFRVGDNDPQALARGIAAAADELARSIALLRAQRPTLGRPIVAGFSQGGMLSYALALRHPDLVELSHPISGLLPEPLWPADKPSGKRYPRIVAMHGDADRIVPIEPARRLHAHLRELGYAAELSEFADVGHHITPRMEALTVELLEATARSLAGSAAPR